MAIIVGMLFIGFLTSWDYEGLFEGVKSLISPEEKPKISTGLKQVEFPGFANFAFDCLKACGFGNYEKDCGAVYVKPTQEYDMLNQENLEKVWKNLNLCSDCNNLAVKSYELPRVVNVSCEEGMLVVK